MSIRPEFAEAILSGKKRFEFRRVAFARRVDVVIIYVTVPVKLVVAEFHVRRIIRKRIAELWRLTRSFAGIDAACFRSYFSGRDYGWAIEIGKIRRYRTPVCPMRKFGVRAPQSFAYINS